MSLRDVARHVDAYSRRQEDRLKRAYLVAAAQTCELVNILGSAYSSKEKPWAMMTPMTFYKNWTGEGTIAKVDQEYVEFVLAGIKEREASVRFMGQN